MVPNFFCVFKTFWFLRFHRLPCDLENARVLYKIKRKFAFFFGEYQIYFIPMFSTHSMKYFWHSPQKSKYPLYM